MGLWGSFGRSFQKENTTRTIRTIRTIADSDTRKSNSAYSASSAYIDKNLKKAQQGEVPAKVEAFTLPEPIEEPKADAGEVMSIGEIVAAGWGTEPGAVAEVGAKARARFTSPPTNRRGFPDFPAFCAGYGAGCGRCRFFHQGKGPFCLVWAEAWPDFQREAEPARCGYPIVPEEKDAKAGRERLQADVAEVRARLKRAPLQYPDGPDWFAFCPAYPEGCDNCRYYAREKACWCKLWESCFPGTVRWYDWPE